MTDRTNRFSVVFASGVSIATTVIYCLLTLITLRNCFSVPDGLGVISAIITIVLLLAATPAVLVSIGMILSCVSGRKNEVSPGGIMCTKIGILLFAISSFIGGLLATVGVLISVIMYESFVSELSMSGYGSSNDEVYMFVPIVLVVLLIIALAVSIISLMYGIKWFSLLGRIRWYEVKKEEIKTGFLKVITIILAVFNGIGLIVNIIASAVNEQLVNYLYYFIEETAGSEYIPRMIMPNPIISNFSGICNLTFWILLVVLLGKTKYIFNMSGREMSINYDALQGNIGANGQYNPNVGNYNVYDMQNNNDFGANKEMFFDTSEVETFIVEGNNQTDRLNRNTSGCGKITSMSGRDAGYCYEIRDGEELVIGLSPSVSNIVVDSSFSAVSRRHCAIKYIADTDEYFVIDYSTNGTFLNGGAKLNKNSYVAVSSGTVIKLGNDEVAYRLG